MIIHGTWQNELPKIKDKSVDLIIIDPPYLTTSEAWDREEVVDKQLSTQLFRIAKDSCSLYVWCGIGEKSQSLIRWFPIFGSDWHFKDLITWKKQRGIGMRKGRMYTREECMWFVKDNRSFIWNKEEQYLTGIPRKRDAHGMLNGQNGKPFKSQWKRISNVWDDFTEEGKDVLGFRGHFTPKPEKAIERIILSHTKIGDVVLDCFLGSGTTARVCKKLERNCIGIEKELKYYEICKQYE